MNVFDFLQPMENEKEVQDASQGGRSGQSPGGRAKAWGQDRGAKALFAHNEQWWEMDTWRLGETTTLDALLVETTIMDTATQRTEVTKTQKAANRTEAPFTTTMKIIVALGEEERLSISPKDTESLLRRLRLMFNWQAPGASPGYPTRAHTTAE